MIVRSLWGVAALLLAVFVVYEGIASGWAASAVTLVFLLLPDVALIGAFAERGRLRPERVALYNALHRPWIPLLLVGAWIVLPIPSLGRGLPDGFEIGLAGSAWLLHIACDRVCGYGLRERDGTIRPVGGGRSRRPPCTA